MAVATQEVFAHTDAFVEIWDLGAPTPALTLVSKNGRYGVSLTNTADIATERTKTLGPYEISAPTFAGVGNEEATAVGDHAAGVAVDGTWQFTEIDGVTASTAQSTPIYITGAGALTTTEANNTKVGEVNFPATYAKAVGVAPVKIGV